MRKFIFLLMTVLLTGCVSINVPSAPSMPSQEKKELNAINKIRVGMAYDEVAQIMGTHTIIGYEVDPQNPNHVKPIALTNPYRQEILSSPTKTYQIFYYYTSVGSADDMIAEDELTPLVFVDKELIGIGIDFLFKLKSELSL